MTSWRKIKCQVPNNLKISPPLFSGCQIESRLTGVKLNDSDLYVTAFEKPSGPKLDYHLNKGITYYDICVIPTCL